MNTTTPSVTTFDDFGLAEPILRAVTELGYREPTPIQVQAIPIVLIAPGRRECRNTTCARTAAGEWTCSEGLSSTFPTVRLAERDPANPTRGPIDVPPNALGSPATIARDKFVGRLKAGGGSFLTARSDSEWLRGLDSVRSLLDRQWTVVFEPSSPAVQSTEVRIKVRDRARP